MNKVIIPVLIWAVIGTGMVQAAEIPTAPGDVRPLLIGSEVPDVTVRTPDAQSVNLRDVVREKASVIIFYRGGWCPYCTAHLSDLIRIEADLVHLGYQVLAISADRPEILAEGIGGEEYAYRLLSDASMAAADAFGIAFRVDDDTVELYKGYDIDLEEASGESHHRLPVPAVFVAGVDGTIRFTYVDPDYRRRIDADVLLAAAKAALK